MLDPEGKPVVGAVLALAGWDSKDGNTVQMSVTPKGDSTTLRIVEDGEVYNPVFRFVSRFVIGHTATIDRYLRDLGKHFGQKDVVIAAS